MAVYTNGANTLAEYLTVEVAFWQNAKADPNLSSTAKTNAAEHVFNLQNALKAL